MQPYEVFTKGDRVLEIYVDEDATNPRKDRDNLGIITCFDRTNFKPLCDNNYLCGLSFPSFTELEKYLKENMDAVIVLPLIVYSGRDYNIYSIDPEPETIRYEEHYGLSGIMYTTASRIASLCGNDPMYYTKEWLTNTLIGELEEYNAWCRSDVYGFITYTTRTCPCCGQIVKENENSCWGFYGTDWKKNGLFDAAGFISSEL